MLNIYSNISDFKKSNLEQISKSKEIVLNIFNYELII